MPFFLLASEKECSLQRLEVTMFFWPTVGRADLTMKALCPELWLVPEETWPKLSL